MIILTLKSFGPVILSQVVSFFFSGSDDIRNIVVEVEGIEVLAVLQPMPMPMMELLANGEAVNACTVAVLHIKMKAIFKEAFIIITFLWFSNGE